MDHVYYAECSACGGRAETGFNEDGSGDCTCGNIRVHLNGEVHELAFPPDPFRRKNPNIPVYTVAVAAERKEGEIPEGKTSERRSRSGSAGGSDT